MRVQHERRESGTAESPEKPVTRSREKIELAIAAAPTMWSLAFAVERDAERACRVQAFYDHAGKSAIAALELAVWLRDQLLARIRDDEVTSPWANELIHELVDCIEQGAPPGTTHPKIGTSSSELRLPCQDCGCAFTSRFRGGRYRRTCGKCFRYTPSPPEQHPRGGLVQFKQGVYPNHRRGQTLGVTEYGTSVVCDHPDCLVLVLVTRSDRNYCAEHLTTHREQIRRLRRRRSPKCERFLFRLAPGQNSVQYHWGSLAEETMVPPEGRFARNEPELQTLVQLVASGALVVTDTRSAEHQNPTSCA